MRKIDGHTVSPNAAVMATVILRTHAKQKTLTLRRNYVTPRWRALCAFAFEPSKAYRDLARIGAIDREERTIQILDLGLLKQAAALYAEENAATSIAAH